MKTRAKRNAKWRAAAADMVNRLKADRYNGLMLAHPWSRAANSMVTGWRIRLSQPPAKGNARVTARPTWKVFARLAAKIAARMAYRARKSDWYLWATRRVAGHGIRYIPKSKRNW
jgi:hypothetical protein